MKLSEFKSTVKESLKDFSGLFNSSLSTTLFAVFLTLKLIGVIDWSWWWVTAPLWIGIALWVVLIIIIALILWIAYLAGKIEIDED